MEFIDQKLDDYVCMHTSEEDDLLKELNRQTHLKILQPRMLSGHFQGRFLSMISKMIQPTSILEIGTYTGYSALCLAEGLKSNGKLLTIDKNPELEDFVRNFLEKSAYSENIEYVIADAMKYIPTINQSFDLVFIDADKGNYLNYYQLVIDMIPSGGYILADNVLWSGKVIDEKSVNDKDTKAIMEFNQYVMNDIRVENVLLPIRDGLLLMRKK
ncbi:MAG: O-methyltransferase [Crocinitomicaceae bacterium]|jgi:caffeoyl-CoA O-methyltransferase